MFRLPKVLNTKKYLNFGASDSEKHSYVEIINFSHYDLPMKFWYPNEWNTQDQLVYYPKKYTTLWIYEYKGKCICVIRRPCWKWQEHFKSRHGHCT